MSNTQGCLERYIEIDGEQIAVSEEVYLAYRRPLWADKKRREREKRCRDEHGNRCTGDCRLCAKERTGSVLSLDSLAEDGFYPSDDSVLVERIEDSQLIRALHAELVALEPGNREIVRLFASGLTEREIATKVGLSQRGVNKRKTKIFSALRENLKDFV